jgi:hypothetical protein
MFGLSKSFYAKVFFLFIATTLAMFILNQLLIGRIGGGQMRKVFIESQININLRWEKESLSEKMADELKEEWFAGVTRVGLTAGASAPDILVQQVIVRMRALGAVSVRTLDGVEETIKFPLPKGLK